MAFYNRFHGLYWQGWQTGIYKRIVSAYGRNKAIIGKLAMVRKAIEQGMIRLVKQLISGSIDG